MFQKSHYNLNMLEEFLFPQFGEDDHEGRMHFQQDGVTLITTQTSTSTSTPASQVGGFGRAAPIPWPLRSPDLTPLDFFSWGFVKDRVYVPPLPANVAGFRIRITAAVAEVTPEMLRRVWEETEYRWDICRITNGSHNEP
jgi:hypothetical protein